MATQTTLKNHLHRIDGKGYPAYKEIKGPYDFGNFALFVDHVQGDPFAAPSRLRVRLPMNKAGFPESIFRNHSRQIALRDFLARTFSAQCRAVSNSSIGSGKSGLIAMDSPGQQILERSSILAIPQFVEARFVVGLPARGRRVLGQQAAAMLTEDVPKIVQQSLYYTTLHAKQLTVHLNTAEDADILREQLLQLGLIAFIADGATLPRRSGVDDRPLQNQSVVAFKSPPGLRVELNLPYAGKVTGMGIAAGVTLIVGGGYHGKSTLLHALERGVYNHIPGDGRELVVTNPTAVKIRAEDGRRMERVDIRPFINNLPGQSRAAAFSTNNASGSTSQAANIIEALEVGTQLLLLDEDTCATNLMIRDARMQALVEKSGEPITPFIDRVRQLSEERRVSSILVLGGSGDYFDVADTIIRMDNYTPVNVTQQAKVVAKQLPTGRQAEAGGAWPELLARIPVAESLNPRKGKRAVNIKARALRAILFGTEEIDVSAVSQLVDEGQLRAIGQALNLARKEFMNNRLDVAGVINAVTEAISEEGLDALDHRPTGDYVAFRPFELAAALNRLRTLRIRNRK